VSRAPSIYPSSYHIVLLSVFVLAMSWSAWHPHDYFTWFLEVTPAMIGLVLVLGSYMKFRLTDLTYTLIVIHCIILMIGGHYTYAEMPLFSWLRDTFDLARNYYDRVGHVAQGFVPAILAREILIRRSPLKPGKWMFYIVTSICLAFSAFYEMVEWWVAVSSGDDAVAFLATQGDVWDTQWDMFLALLGAMASQLLLARFHDRQLKRLDADIG